MDGTFDANDVSSSLIKIPKRFASPFEEDSSDDLFALRIKLRDLLAGANSEEHRTHLSSAFRLAVHHPQHALDIVECIIEAISVDTVGGGRRPLVALLESLVSKKPNAFRAPVQECFPDLVKIFEDSPRISVSFSRSLRTLLSLFSDRRRADFAQFEAKLTEIIGMSIAEQKREEEMQRQRFGVLSKIEAFREQHKFNREAAWSLSFLSDRSKSHSSLDLHHLEFHHLCCTRDSTFASTSSSRANFAHFKTINNLDAISKPLAKKQKFVDSANNLNPKTTSANHKPISVDHETASADQKATTDRSKKPQSASAPRPAVIVVHIDQFLRGYRDASTTSGRSGPLHLSADARYLADRYFFYNDLCHFEQPHVSYYRDDDDPKIDVFRYDWNDDPLARFIASHSARSLSSAKFYRERALRFRYIGMRYADLVAKYCGTTPTESSAVRSLRALEEAARRLSAQILYITDQNLSAAFALILDDAGALASVVSPDRLYSTRKFGTRWVLDEIYSSHQSSARNILVSPSASVTLKGWDCVSSVSDAMRKLRFLAD